MIRPTILFSPEKPGREQYFKGSLMSFPGPEPAAAFAVCGPWSQITLHRITSSDIDLIRPFRANRLFSVDNLQACGIDMA